VDFDCFIDTEQTMNHPTGFCRMDNPATVFLPLIDKVADGAIRLVEFVQNEDSVFSYEDDAVPQNGCRILSDGIEYVIFVAEVPDEILRYRKIFCDVNLTIAKSVVAVSFGENVAGGQRVAPIAQGLMRLAGRLAMALDALAIGWVPSKLMSGKEYFGDAVDTYEKGGAFPVLPTIDLGFAEGVVETSGLEWFSGQELCLTGSGLTQSDLVRRAVRIVHDIATNGAVFSSQQVADIDADKHISLDLSPGGQRVFANIRSNMEQVSI
jgi:hypothetical protein